MKNNFIRLFTVFILLSIALTGCGDKVSYPEPTKEFYINDFAGALSSDTEREIIDIGTTLKSKTGAQVVVALIKNLNGADIDDYSVELGRRWGIGQKDKNNGVLILAAMDDHKDAIEVGYGLEGAITDAETGRIRRNFIEAEFKNENYDSGILKAYKYIALKIYKEYNITPPENLNGISPTENYKESEIKLPHIGAVIIGLIIAAYVLSRIFRGPRGPFGRRRFNRGGFYGGFFGGGFGGDGGGGFGGGDSGGGGSFGGGGSSGGW